MSESCATCGSLPASYLAQTGYGDSLPEAAGLLESLDIDNRHDVRRCPTCGALFYWEDLPQFFGSGNLDEERLDRLNDSQAALVLGLLADPAPHGSPEELVAGAARELPLDLFHAILYHQLYRLWPGFDPLVPALIELLAETDDQPLVTVLLDWTTRKKPLVAERLRFVLERLERGGRPLPPFGEVLRKLARERLEALGK